MRGLARRRPAHRHAGRQIVFEPTADKVEVLRRPADAPVMWLTAEQSNSSLIVDDAVMLKIFRRISTGEHPEAEMSRYLTAHRILPMRRRSWAR